LYYCAETKEEKTQLSGQVLYFGLWNRALSRHGYVVVQGEYIFVFAPQYSFWCSSVQGLPGKILFLTNMTIA
jgi:hypothetical protein